MKHITVFYNEVSDLLKVKEEGNYADLTLGGGGHSLKILESLKSGNLFVFDLDIEAINNFSNQLHDQQFEKVKSASKNIQVLSKGSLQVHIINDNFIKLNDYLDGVKLDGIIADLGWSTDQLEGIEGLSYSEDSANLDMRFDKNLGVKASDLLNALNKRELEKMFKEYSDIYGRLNEQLVSEIIRQRELKLFEKVEDVKKVVDKVFGKSSNKNSIYSKVFQALRIAVNQELSNLKAILEEGFENLKADGIFLVITFHSGESKIAQSFFDLKVKENKAVYLTKKFAVHSSRGGEVFFTPSVEELKNNINSRSAKLYGIQLKNN